jgi:hypothetical protein
VVEVTVREEHRLDVIAARDEPAPVRKDEVDTEVLGVGEEHAAVDDGDPPVDLDGRHVAPDAAESAEERDDLHRAARRMRGRRSCGRSSLLVGGTGSCGEVVREAVGAHT